MVERLKLQQQRISVLYDPVYCIWCEFSSWWCFRLNPIGWSGENWGENYYTFTFVLFISFSLLAFNFFTHTHAFTHTYPIKTQITSDILTPFISHLMSSTCSLPQLHWNYCSIPPLSKSVSCLSFCNTAPMFFLLLLNKLHFTADIFNTCFKAVFLFLRLWEEKVSLWNTSNK